jgi:cytochrome c oxidase cbb3-type subunit IV
MIQNVLREIGGIGVYDMISICLFVVVFSGALIWAACLKKPFLNSISSMPLEDDECLTQKKGDRTDE